MDGCLQDVYGVTVLGTLLVVVVVLCQRVLGVNVMAH